MAAVQIAPGFADPVIEAQSVFRRVMMALARPGTIEVLPVALAPPPSLTAELAAVALALCDHETPVWLDARLANDAGVADFLRFHTGAKIVGDPGAAAFAFAADPANLPPLAEFAQGTDEYPDRSTTLVMAVDALAEGGGMVLEGPGIADHARLAVGPLPPDFIGQFAENRRLFPRGVDCIFVGESKVAALPRSTRVGEA